MFLVQSGFSFKSLKQDFRFPKILLPLTAFLCFLLLLWGRMPGIFALDSTDQLHQAQGLRPYHNWHPPALAYFWHFELWLARGHFEIIFLTFAALFIFALYRLLNPLALPPWKTSLLFLILFFSPMFSSTAGDLTKDGFLSVLLLLLAGFFGYSLHPAKGKAEKSQTFLSSVVFLFTAFCALLLRFNAAFAVVPLVIGYFSPQGWRFSAKTMLFCLLLLPLALSAIPFLNKAFPVMDYHPEKSLELFDLAGIEAFLHPTIRQQNLPLLKTQNFFSSPQWQRRSFAEKEALCYTPKEWDSLMWGKCGQALKEADHRSFAPLKAEWKNAIIKHPVSYLKHRLAHFSYFLGFNSTLKTHLETVDSGGFASGIYESEGVTPETKREVPLVQKYQSLMGKILRFSPLGWGIFWLSLGFILFLKTIKGETVKDSAVNCLSFAALMYLGGYFFCGVACLWRYILPSVFLLLAALILYFFSPPSQSSSTKPAPHDPRP